MLLFILLIPLIIWILPFTKLKDNKITKRWVINNLVSMAVCIALMFIFFSYWGLKIKGIIFLAILIGIIWAVYMLYMRYRNKFNS